MSHTKKKPTLQLRKPGQTSARDAFIAGDPVEEIRQPLRIETSGRPDVSTSERPDTQTSRRSDVQTSKTVTHAPEAADARSVRRRTTIYFEDDVYKKLKLHCALHDTEMSQTVSKAVAHWLTQHPESP